MSKQKTTKRSVTKITQAEKDLATQMAQDMAAVKAAGTRARHQGKVLAAGQSIALARMGPARYGDHYFCVETTDSGPTGRRIFFYADYVAVVQGDLTAYSRYPRLPVTGAKYQMVLALAHGEWERFYAASSLNGLPLAIDVCPPQYGEDNAEDGEV